MSIPAFLDQVANPYKYIESQGMVDVADIITMLRLKLVTQLGWSEPSTALFKTPVDAAGRFMDILVTRISAAVVEFRLRDAAAHTIFTRRISINTTSGSAVRFYASSLHCIVESLLGSVIATEVFVSYLLDVAPLALADISIYVGGNAHLSGTSTNDNVFTNCGTFFMWDNGAAANLGRLRRRDASINNGIVHFMYSQTMRYRFYDAHMEASFGANVRWAGRVPHMLVCDSGIGYGTRRRPTIDTNTRATYQVLAITQINNTRMMVRCAD